MSGLGLVGWQPFSERDDTPALSGHLRLGPDGYRAVEQLILPLGNYASAHRSHVDGTNIGNSRNNLIVWRDRKISVVGPRQVRFVDEWIRLVCNPYDYANL